MIKKKELHSLFLIRSFVYQNIKIFIKLFNDCDKKATKINSQKMNSPC